MHPDKQLYDTWQCDCCECWFEWNDYFVELERDGEDVVYCDQCEKEEE